MADPPRAVWVFTRQKRRARWRAGPHRVGIAKLHAAFCERIDMRSLDVVRPVAADPVFAQVIDHDAEDVGLGYRRLPSSRLLRSRTVGRGQNRRVKSEE